MKLITTIVLAGMIVGLTTNSGAQVPRLLSYQGFLGDNQGVPKPDGIYALTFRLYTLSSGGSAIWTEAKSVELKNGLFSTVLGDLEPLDAVAFDRQYWLGIQVATDPEFSPRVQLAASAYGISAIRSDTALLALSPWRLNGSTVYYDSGNVGIGSNTPEYPLTFGNSAGDKISLWNNYGAGTYYGLGLGSYQLQVHTDIPEADVVFGSGTSSSFNESARIKGSGILAFPATLQKKITLYPGTAGDAGFGYSTNLLKIYSDDPGSDIAFGYDQSGTFAERLRIQGNGNVGIGTSSPQQQLSVANALNIDQSNSNNGSVANALTFGSSSGEGVASKRTAGGNQYGLDFFTGSMNRMSILNTGNVGIGTSSPNYPVDIVSNQAANHILSVVSGATSGGIDAIYGFAAGTGNVGVKGEALGGNGVAGISDGTGNGIIGISYNLLGVGVHAVNTAAGTALTCDGNADIRGNMTVGGALFALVKLFQIDHPLDPENKILNHYCSEGPEPLNLYSGTATIDAAGEAWITLPDYFESINKDFRYQLTAVGASMPNLYVESEIQGNRFKIAGGVSGKKVSWQVSGVRNDLYIQRAGITTEAVKEGNKRGKYISPELYGMPANRGMYWDEQAEVKSDSKK